MTATQNAKQMFLLTIFPDKLPDGTYQDFYDFCSFRFPNPDRYDEHFRCFIHQHEVGGESGRHHIQAFISTKRRLRYSQITKILGLRPNQIHYEPVVRTPQAAWDYCSVRKRAGDSGSNEESTRHGCDAFEFGERPVAVRGGQRSGAGRPSVDWPRLLELAGGEQSDRELLHKRDGDSVLAISHWNAYRSAKAVLRAPRNVPAEWSERYTIVYYGSAGAGKSRRVRAECATSGLSLWVSPVGTCGLWYDGYDGHAAALFDDFVGGMSFRDLLNLLEGNQVLVPIKGSFVTWRPSLVYFTSDRHWREWMFPKGKDQGLGPMSEEEQAQLGRRISMCVHIEGDPVPLSWALGMQSTLPVPARVLCADDLRQGSQDGVEPICVGGGGGDNTDAPPPPHVASPPVSQPFSPII